MVSIKANNQPKLKIVIPTLNEASNLPILLADISECLDTAEVTIVDGGSSDKTASIASLLGCKIEVLNEPNRGAQMHRGALISKADWILFLHADSRLSKHWSDKIFKLIKSKSSSQYAWFLNFKVNRKGIWFRILEFCVFIRSNLLKRPYGDQGLLISKKLYFDLGGFKEIPIMEDIDIILRISKLKKLKALNLDIQTSSRRWEKGNIFFNAIKSAVLRYRWSQGETPKELFKNYYSKNN